MNYTLLSRGLKLSNATLEMTQQAKALEATPDPESSILVAHRREEKND